MYIFMHLIQARYNCAKFYHREICVTDFRGGGVFLWSSLPSILEQPPKRQVLNRAKTVLSINHDLKIYFDVISRSANARSPLGATAASLLFISCLIIL